MSTPFTCCSIGTATLSAITGALAPGHIPVADTVGGVMSGVSSIGRLGTATVPNSAITIETTKANTGRWMKKRENIVSASFRRPQAAAPRPVAPWASRSSPA